MEKEVSLWFSDSVIACTCHRMVLFGVLFLVLNSSHIGNDVSHVTSVQNENEAFHSLVYFLYRIVSPVIFIVVIFILLWYIVLSIFRWWYTRIYLFNHQNNDFILNIECHGCHLFFVYGIYIVGVIWILAHVHIHALLCQIRKFVMCAWCCKWILIGI